MSRADRRAARRAQKRAWARRHTRVLVVVFAAFLLAGLLLANPFAVAAGVAGLGWVAVSQRQA